MIVITRSVVESIVAQARAQAPLEACGYLAAAGGVAGAEYPMRNVDASGEHYSMDPQEQFAVVRTIRAERKEIVAVWHSHPATPARLSDEDIRLAFDESIAYVIVSLAGERPDVKAFRVSAGSVAPEELRIT